MKKFFTFCAAALIAGGCIVSLNSCDTLSGGFYYTLKKDNTISVYVEEYNMSELVIPDSIDGFRVTGIKAPKKSSKFNNILTDIYFPETIKDIEKGAFKGCIGLETINFPSALITIGKSAFESCSSITEVRLPKTVTTLGDKVFKNCSALNNAYIPNATDHIGSDAFEGCPDLNIYVARSKPGFWGGPVFVAGWFGTATVNWDYDGYGE